MAKKKTQSTPKAIASKSMDANPSSYAARYQFSMEDGGQILPKSNAAVHPALRHVQFVTEGNEVNAYIPALASGYMSRVGGITGGDDWDPFKFANWNSSSMPLVPVGDGKDEIRRAISWWKKDPLVFKCVKVLTQLSNSRATLRCEDPAFLEICTNWFNKAMPHSFRKSWFREYYRTSMVPTVKTLIPYKPKNFKTNKAPVTLDGNVVHPSAKGSQDATEAILARNQKCYDDMKGLMDQYQAAQAMNKLNLCSADRLSKLKLMVQAAQYEWTKNMIPGSYAVLDPLMVDIEGPKDMPWLRQPYLRVAGDLQTAITNPTEEQRSILSRLPVEIVQQINDGESKVWLSPNIGSVTYGEKQDYELYPTPITSHIQDALEMKYLLMAMDKATAKSLRDRILQVTVGNDEYPAGEDELKTISNIFNSPGRNLTIFWNHTLKITFIEPSNIMLGDDSKYHPWNNEIRTAYGISEVMTGTSDKTGSIGNSMLNLKGVEEEVEEGQAAFRELFLNEINMLRQALGVKYDVDIEFDRLNLKDEETFMAVIQGLVQNGLLDHQTAIETMKFHFPSVQGRMEKIKLLQKKGKGIFLAQPSSNNLGPDGMKPKAGIPTGGRPAKTGKPGANKQKKGKSQPKAKGSTEFSAKLLEGDGSINAYLVCAVDALDSEDRDLVAEKFSIPAEWVVTEDEYHEATSKHVDWMEPLPELSTAETLATIRKGEQVIAQIKKATEEGIEEFKQTHANKGPRGAYVTAQKREEIESGIVVKTLVPMTPDVPADELSKRIYAARASIAETFPNELEQHVHAACMLFAQYAKKK